MNAVVFEHVPVTDLPAEWRAKMSDVTGATVTVRIETEDQGSAEDYANDPLFGMWRDRDDMANVADYVRGIRTDRFGAKAPATD